MTTLTRDVAEQVKLLPDVEKLTLINELLAQLDRPDPEIDRVWADEARARWQAYREGKTTSVSYAEVMAKYKRP
jgi:hypothetical protein